MYKSVFKVIGFSILVQCAGFMKLLLISHYFGVSACLDGYYLALVIPSLLLGFVTGAIQTGFMPVYGKIIVSGDACRGIVFRSTFFWLVIGSLSLLCITLNFLGPLTTGILVPRDSVQVVEAYNYCYKILIFSLLLNSTIDYISIVLNSHGYFASAAGAPALNIIVSAAILYLWPDAGLRSLVWGLMIGLSCQLGFLLWTAWRAKIFFRMVFNLSSTDIERAVKLMGPIFLGIALTNANISIDQAMAARAGEGAVSILGYAGRLHNAVAQVGVMGVSIVLLPQLIRLIGAEREGEALLLLHRLFLWALVVSCIICAVIILAGKDLLTLLLKGGAFGNQDVISVYNVWICYAVGLFPMAAGVFLAKFFQAIELPHMIARMAMVSFSMNIFFNYLFVTHFGVEGIAVSTTLVYGIVSFLFYRALKKRRMRYGGSV